MGVLNGAFTIGTPDGACHLLEEVPRPRIHIPWAIAAQIVTGFVSSFVLYIALVSCIALEQLPANRLALWHQLDR